MVAQVGMDAVHGPRATAVIHNPERAFFRINKRPQPRLLPAFFVGEGGCTGAVGDDGALCQGIDAESSSLHIGVVAVPIHGLAIHIQHTAIVTNRQITGNLRNITDNHGGTTAHDHIVGSPTVFLLQIGLAAAAHGQQGIGVARAVYVQIARAGLAPLGHVILGVGELQVHLCPFVDDIAGVVEHVVLPRSRADGETRLFQLPGIELCVADTQIHRGIQHHFVLCLRGVEYQVLCEEQVNIALLNVRIRIPSIPILQVAYAG